MIVIQEKEIDAGTGNVGLRKRKREERKHS